MLYDNKGKDKLDKLLLDIPHKEKPTVHRVAKKFL